MVESSVFMRCFSPYFFRKKAEMKKISSKIFIFLLAFAFVLSSCSGTETKPESAAETSEPEASEEVSGSVASAEEMTDIEEVTWSSMVPLNAGDISDGEYEINVDSSSSMFNIDKCVLKAENGSMTAVMTMGGTGYRYIAMMSAEEAASAGESEYIYPEEDPEGHHTFTVPVEALDKGVKCAAFSDKKEKWYDRTLVFRASGLPLEAYREGVLVTPSSLGLADGTYSVEAGFEGGSGKAGVDSPTQLTVQSGAATAVITWSSPNYDYMIVGGEKYLPVNADGNSVFEIPVPYFDRPVFVIADTTAMSQPYEIEYALTFDSQSVK